MYDRDHETRVHDHTPARSVIEAASQEEGPWPIHGVAVAAGDVLHDKDGEPMLVTAEGLANAEYSPAASKLTKDHPDFDGVSPPVDATVGNNSMGYSADGEAIAYDAETHDEAIATGVEGGTYDVSIHAGYTKGPPDPDTGLPTVENMVFHDLSVVSVGDSKSNTAQYGGRSDVAAWARSGGLEAAVSEIGAGTDAGAAPADDDTVGLLRRLANRLGFSLEAGGDGAQHSDEGPDSLPDADPDADDATAADTTMDRDDYIADITEHSDLGEDDLAEMSDDAVERTHGLVDVEDDTPEDEDTGDDVTPPAAGSIGDMTPDELGAALREQGFVTADDVGETVEASRTAATKGQQVDEIIAQSDDYGEDDREELEASPPSVVGKIHKAEATPSAAPIPGWGGARDRVRASVGEDDEHDLDDYGTGVSE